ncbi:MAG TPA: TIGR02147 family protein [Bdellovibrionota bacterium]|nr:TIGR02147 family protein [Bdellovibrionota bacterium]
MGVSVFDFDNYREYMNKKIRQLPSQGHGARSRLAEKLRCHPGYVTQVMNGIAEFSLEQAALINDFLEHTEDEGEFFILLVQMTRAGNEHLRKYCRRRMQQIQKQRTVLKDRLNYQRTLSLEEQMKYYSAWYYAAIHMAPGISGISTPEKIARYLGLSLSTVISALDFLVSIGLLTVDGGNYSVGTGQLHLGNDSNLITKHHTNWRIESIKALDKESSDDLHYSSIVTLSHSDIPRVRETLLRAIDQVRAIVRPSQNEQMICYNLDLFKLNKQ